ncbi:MAG: UDP-3-O-(3-hydroxymyristoyl)glucosamine N-acyltransferase [Synergistaceae bacterium]|nr:UDP-3-O-(3-hydroxymyristoyl)glucosamine N-acyltransferase [Synergistaceae bacterium]
MKKKQRTLNDIACATEGKAVGAGQSPVVGVASPEKVRSGEICALWKESDTPDVSGGVFFLASPDFFASSPDRFGVAVEDPRSAFPLLLSLFEEKEKKAGIHPSAVVDPDASISPLAWIGPLSIVEEGATVEEGVQLRGRVFIGKECLVGAHSVIEPGAVLLESVRTGQNCLIHAGAVLGCDGFGILPGEEGAPPRKIPQLGGVLLGDGVEIGACTTVDRGTLDDTEIGSFTKVDDHVHIAHNVRIGRGCIVVAMTGIAGSVVLEDNVTMAARSGAADHVCIGRGATVAAYGGATKDVPPGVVVSGFPARDHGANFRVQAALRHLPDLLGRVKRLEREILPAKDAGHRGKSFPGEGKEE